MPDNALPSAEIALQIILSVGIILIIAKYLGTLLQKVGFPQVAGQIIAGLLLHFIPFFKNYGAFDANVVYKQANSFISSMAEIGVVMIMFSADLGRTLNPL